jgi:hypothetical protein
MNENRIAEIRKRHALADEYKSVIRPSGFSWTIPGWQAHNDRATLLAEVEKLSAENARLRAQVAEYFSERETHPVEDA